MQPTPGPRLNCPQNWGWSMDSKSAREVSGNDNNNYLKKKERKKTVLGNIKYLRQFGSKKLQAAGAFKLQRWIGAHRSYSRPGQFKNSHFKFQWFSGPTSFLHSWPAGGTEARSSCSTWLWKNPRRRPKMKTRKKQWSFWLCTIEEKSVIR